MSRLSVWFQSCSLSNLPHVFPITCFVFSNSPHLEPRLVCLVPCVFKPQSVQTIAVKTLIIFLFRVPSTPVILRFLYRHRFGFWFFESALSPWFIRTSDSWFLTSALFPVDDSCLPLLYLDISDSDLDLDSVFDHSFVLYCESVWLALTLAWINNNFCLRPGLHLAPYSDVTTIVQVTKITWVDYTCLLFPILGNTTFYWVLSQFRYVMVYCSSFHNFLFLLNIHSFISYTNESTWFHVTHAFSWWIMSCNIRLYNKLTADPSW